MGVTPHKIVNQLNVLWHYFWRRYLPKTLSKQLALFNSVVLTITIISFAVYSAHTQTQEKINSSHEQLKAFANNIAMLSSEYVALEETDELSQHLQQLIQYPGLTSIVVFRDNLQNAVEVKRINNKQSSVQIIGIRDVQFIGGSSLIRVNDIKMQVWHPILEKVNSTNRIGWVRLDYDTSALNAIAVDVMKRSLSIALVAVLISLIALRRLLSGPMKSLKTAAEFAEWLDISQGRQLTDAPGSQEIETLVRALNQTSRKLGLQEAAQHSTTLMLDFIREIQQQFISELDSSVLFDKCLSDVLQLTQSDIGFIGEVLYQQNQKPYIRVLSISDIAWDEKSKLMYGQQLSSGMEFHSLHTLFGSILQTGKTVITNDAAGDPRSAGLPVGHKAIHSFLGLPIYSNTKLVGIVAVANNIKGYDQGQIAYLQPLLSTFSHIIEACRTKKRKQDVQQELHDSSALLTSILNTVTDAVITINDDGKIEMINPAAASIFSCSAKKVIGVSIDRFLPGLWVNGSLATGISILHHSKDIGIIERVAVKANNATVPVEVQVGEFMLDEKVKYTLTVKDISNRKKIEYELRENENRLKVAQSIAKIGSWEIEPDTQAMYCSDECLVLFNLEVDQEEDDLYNEFIDRIHPEDRDKLLSAIKNTIKTAKPFDVEHRIVTTCGKEVYIRNKGQIQQRSYDRLFIVGVAQDITESTQFARRKNDLVSTVSHGLRTPLTAIKGALGLMEADSVDNLKLLRDEKEKNLLGIACHNTDRLLVLIDGILDIDKLESGHNEFNSEPIILEGLLQHLIDDHMCGANENQVLVKLLDSTDHSEVIADEKRLKQVLNNLLSNAIKYSLPGGEVEVHVDFHGDYIRISVIDTGIGIPSDFEPFVFDKFSQANSLWKRDAGTGLGLSICRAIVEQMDGKIGFISEENIGSTFYVDLPQIDSAIVVSRVV